MKQRLVWLLVLIVVLCVAATAQKAQGAALNGMVVDRQQRPVPGLSVVLVMQKGERAPGKTDKNGRFLIPNVPPGRGYFVEVYWGKDLMYRQPVNVAGDTNLGMIRL
jgi:hypothetical protein